MQLKEMEMRAIASVAQLQQEQQQQQPAVTGASPTSGWQTSSSLQSPASSEMSPGYGEMSPSHERQQLGPPGSPNKPQVQVWVGQAHNLVPAPNTTVADAKLRYMV